MSALFRVRLGDGTYRLRMEYAGHYEVYRCQFFVELQHRVVLELHGPVQQTKTRCFAQVEHCEPLNEDAHILLRRIDRLRSLLGFDGVT